MFGGENTHWSGLPSIKDLAHGLANPPHPALPIGTALGTWPRTACRSWYLHRHR